MYTKNGHEGGSDVGAESSKPPIWMGKILTANYSQSLGASENVLRLLIDIGDDTSSASGWHQAQKNYWGYDDSGSTFTNYSSGTANRGYVYITYIG